MGNRVDGCRVRLLWMVSHAKSEGAQGHRAPRVLHGDEDCSKAAIRPRNACLDAPTEHCAVSLLVVASHEPRLRASKPTGKIGSGLASATISPRRRLATTRSADRTPRSSVVPRRGGRGSPPP